MVVRTTFNGLSEVQTIYLEADRKRTEFRNSRGRIQGPRLASITRCDIGQDFELNLDAGEYESWPYPAKTLTTEDYAAAGIPQPKMVRSDKPTLRVTRTTVDTGDRKDFFGHIARHFITTIKQIKLDGSQSQESVTDGWYVDLDLALSCDPKLPKGTASTGYVTATLEGEPYDRPEFIDIGDRPGTGFPVELNVETNDTYVLSNGIKKQSRLRFDRHVLQLYEGPSDPGIFEIPSGFKQVRKIERNPKAQDLSNTSIGWWNELKIRLAGFL
jgi:hypothetical protein